MYDGQCTFGTIGIDVILEPSLRLFFCGFFLSCTVNAALLLAVTGFQPWPVDCGAGGRALCGRQGLAGEEVGQVSILREAVEREKSRNLLYFISHDIIALVNL